MRRLCAGGRAVTCAALLAYGVAQAQDLPGVGPLRLGMTADEIRAATPDVEWRVRQASRYTGRVFHMVTESPMTVSGQAVDIEARLDRYVPSLRVQADLSAGTAEACEHQALVWLSALEGQMGPVHGREPRRTPGTGGGLQWQVQRAPSGAVTVTPSPRPGSPDRVDGETLSFGNASTVLAEAFDEDHQPRRRRGLFLGEPPRLRLSASRSDRGVEVDVEIGFHSIGDRPQCMARVTLAHRIVPPLSQPFVMADHPLRRQVSVAERHLAYHEGVAPPAAPVDVELRCDVDRQIGWTHACGVIGPPDLGRPLQGVALRLASLMAFDMSGVDRDDPQMMRGTVRVRLAPDDRRPIDFLQTPTVATDEVEFVRRADDADLARAYPEQVLGDPAADRPAVDVALSCRIEHDGSLLCAPGAPVDHALGQAFERAAVHLAGTAFRAAPAMRSGAPSAGQVVAMLIPLRPPSAAPLTMLEELLQRKNP